MDAAASHDILASATALRAGGSGRVGLVLGGGLAGLACAYELARRGVAVPVVDGGAPSEAPASSAAAGMLDPLTVKGRAMRLGEAGLPRPCAASVRPLGGNLHGAALGNARRTAKARRRRALAVARPRRRGTRRRAAAWWAAGG